MCRICPVAHVCKLCVVSVCVSRLQTVCCVCPVSHICKLCIVSVLCLTSVSWADRHLASLGGINSGFRRSLVYAKSFMDISHVFFFSSFSSSFCFSSLQDWDHHMGSLHRPGKHISSSYNFTLITREILLCQCSILFCIIFDK